MKGYRLSIIRHGRTIANDKGIYIGKTDYPLLETGRSELLDKLDEFIYPKVERVYSSPLKRCTETAEILFPHKELLLVDDLRELDFGEFEGKSVEELINREEYKHWLKEGIDNAPPNGESLSELSLRSFKALEEIVMDMMREDITHCAVITHSGVMTNMLACFGVPKYKPEQLTCNIGEGYEVLVTAQLWQRSQAFEILGRIPHKYGEEIDLYY